jgi:predicted DCC family thiol-disulfide oxidoreductase YuxK
MSSVEMPDPDAQAHQAVVIYDGHCGFCQAQMARLQRLDRGRRLAYLSLHDPRVAARYPQLSVDDLMRQMYVIDAAGQAHGGADALRYLSRLLPSLWWAMPLFHVPGTRRLQQWCYQQVANRRYQLSGAQCESGTCRVHGSTVK